MAPDQASASASSSYDPQSLQDLQKMRVDDLISWLSENKTDGLPPRATPMDQQYEGLTPESLKEQQKDPQLPARRPPPRKPLKRPPLLWKSYKAKQQHRDGRAPFRLSSDLIKPDAAPGIDPFDPESGGIRPQCRLENHYCSYEPMHDGMIVNDHTRSMALWRGMADDVQDSEPEFIQRRFPDYPPSIMSNLSNLDPCEDAADDDEEEEQGCKFFFLRLAQNK